MENARLIDIDTNALAALIEATVRRVLEEKMPQRPDLPRYVYGLKGIAQIYNCSIRTAHRIKESGKIDDAIKQIGSTIVIDTDIALRNFNVQ